MNLSFILKTYLREVKPSISWIVFSEAPAFSAAFAAEYLRESVEKSLIPVMASTVFLVWVRYESVIGPPFRYVKRRS